MKKYVVLKMCRFVGTISMIFNSNSGFELFINELTETTLKFEKGVPKNFKLKDTNTYELPLVY